MPETVDLGTITKTLEGVGLALSANAEVLSKMDGRMARLEKQDLAKQQEARARQEQSAEQIALQNFEKSMADRIIKSVISNLKKQDQPMADLGKGTDKSVSGKAQWPMSSHPGQGDEEDSDGALDDNKTEQAQQTIAAQDNGADEYPVPPKDIDEDEDDDETLAMMNRISNLEKQLAASIAGQGAAIKGETEDRLRKMGFMEENKLRSPRLVNKTSIGASDGTGDTIQKSLGTKEENLSKKEIVEKLSNESWADLWNSKYNIEKAASGGENLPQSGGTSGFNLPIQFQQ